MRIIGLHVENFGGLCHYAETFDQGLNVRHRPNGWGKSTLAVFIKAMLYGLPASTKRSLIENERKRYAPWQGGVFGGSLDIEVGGEGYRIERSFGAKESDDTLSVISLKTGSRADVAWASAPGEGLFGVDAAAYERSTYLSQRPEEMTKDGSVSIHTKLNHLVDATDDLSNYDTAMELLEKRRRQLRHLTGGGGDIAEGEARADALDRDIERCYAQRTVLSACRERIAQGKQKIEQARTEAQEVQKELSRRLKEREGRAVGARLEALQAEEAELNAILADCRDALGGQEPSQQFMASISHALEAREACERRLADVRFDATDEEELRALSDRFARGIPNEEKLEALRHAAREYNRATVLAMDEDGQPLLVEDEDAEEQCLQIRADVHALREKRRELESRPLQGKSAKVSVPSLILLAMALAFTVTALWYAVLAACAAVCLVLALIFAILHADQRRKTMAQIKQNEQRALQLDEEIRQAELRLQVIEGAARFAKLWRRSYPNEPCPLAAQAALDIERLSALGDRLQALIEKKKQIELSRRACRHALDEAQAHVLTLTRSLVGAPSDTAGLVRWLTECYSRYREALLRRERKQAEIAALRAQYDTDKSISVTSAGEDADVAALEARQGEIAVALAQWTEQLAREEQTEARLTSEVEELDELESEREALALELEQKKETLITIQSAEKYLKEAKESLSGRYLATMQDSFGRYLGELTGEETPVFTMDAQFRVKLRAQGLSRDTDAFSTGVRDLIALCERLSLVDAMFEGERPFLILDDPFTNLDDGTVQRATALVRRVAERYQVLYLTCHSGRVIEGDNVGE